MALNVLGKQFDKLLNVTLCYPDNHRQPFFDMLSGKLTQNCRACGFTAYCRRVAWRLHQ